MTTRISRPAFWRPLALAIALLGFQGYLGYSAIGGQFGIDSEANMKLEIGELTARSVSLQVEIDAYKHRAALFAADSLDPDILTEQARALLSMAHPEDLVIMLDEAGLPVSSSSVPLAESQLTSLIGANSSL